jgi:DNA repair and recombination protein RAD52
MKVSLTPYQCQPLTRSKIFLEVNISTISDPLSLADELELDEADFAMSEDGHPDEVVLPASNASSGNNGMQPPARPMVRSESTGSNHPRQPHTPNHQQPPKPASNAFNGAQNKNAVPAPRPQPQQFNNQRGPVSHNSNNPVAQPQGPGPQAPVQPPVLPPGGAPVGFFSARAVTQIPEDSLVAGQIPPPKGGMAFDPRAESPSIRKTPGIDHSKSKPVARDLKHAPPVITEENPSAPGGPAAAPPGGLQGNKVIPRPNQGGPPMARGNVGNPQLDHTRRIGAPGSSSPLANRNQYRPPTMKRPSGGDGGPLAPGQGRAPLADLPNTDAVTNAGGVGGVIAPDAKRQRMN